MHPNGFNVNKARSACTYSGTVWGMARTPKRLDPYDVAVVDVLRRAADAQGVSGRKLAERSGMGLNRVAIILRGDEPPATVGEVARLALALGLAPSAVFAEAERASATPHRDDYGLAAHTTDEQTDLERFNKAHDDEPA